MLRLVVGVFLVLHGLVHLLYAGQSARLFELETGLAWPDGSWTFTRWLGDTTTRTLATSVYILLAIGFVVGGVGLLFSQSWWSPLAVAAASGGIVFTILFWDGKTHMLHSQGAIGLLMSLAIIVAVQVLSWPQFEL